jgi:hypothetical protein
MTGATLDEPVVIPQLLLVDDDRDLLLALRLQLEGTVRLGSSAAGMRYCRHE